jgi:hypothetical protein
VKEKGQLKIDFHGFQVALGLAAQEKKYTYDEMIRHILASHGPAVNATTTPSAVALHDDPNAYTGVYARGGPDSRVSGKYLDLSMIADRSAADVRGLPVKQSTPARGGIAASSRRMSGASPLYQPGNGASTARSPAGTERRTSHSRSSLRAAEDAVNANRTAGASRMAGAASMSQLEAADNAIYRQSPQQSSHNRRGSSGFATGPKTTALPYDKPFNGVPGPGKYAVDPYYRQQSSAMGAGQGADHGAGGAAAPVQQRRGAAH